MRSPDKKARETGKVGGETVRSEGFTLLELLVAVTIIVILAGLLLSALSKTREKARQAVCVSNLKQIGAGVFMYGEDNDGYLPPLCDDEVRVWWYHILCPYLGRTINLADVSDRAAKQVGITFFKCPSYWNKAYYGAMETASYGVNYCNNSPPDTRFSYPDRLQKLDRLPKTAYLAVDAHKAYTLSPNCRSFDYDIDGDGVLDSYSAYLPTWPYFGICLRHSSFANFLIADGSVKAYRGADWATNKDNIW